MTKEIKQVLFALLRFSVFDEKITEENRELALMPGVLDATVKLAKRHDLAHLVEYALEKNGFLSENGKSAAVGTGEVTMALYRYTQLRHELLSISKTLEAAKIPFIPLKGSVLRGYYPEGWMRTSCDIDVLVHEEDLDGATAALVGALSYKSQGKNSHDVALDTPSKMHIELHYDLIEDGYANESASVLSTVWETSLLSDGFSYRREMPPEMFYFYHIAHMAKHFENGGCGIRPLLDLFILDKAKSADPCRENELLSRGGLLKFADVVRALSKVWFGGREHSEVTLKTENYILTGGVYGTTKNRISLQQQKRGGKFKYLISKIFIPYDVIKFHYPILGKHRWLTPVMEVRRWFKLAFCGHAGRVTREIQYSSSISKKEAEECRDFLDDIGL